MLPIYGVYGASGFGREVMPLLREMLNEDDIPKEALVFIDDGVVGHELNGYKIYTYDEFISIDGRSKHVVLAIANSKIREKLATKCKLDNINLLSVKASNVMTMDDVTIGDGAILSPFAANISVTLL